MHSPTILLLLSAVIGLASGTIYWSQKHMDAVQTQCNLALHAYRTENYGLLYDLIEHGKGIDRYMKTHPKQIYRITVEEALEVNGGTIKSKVGIMIDLNEGSLHYDALLDLAPSKTSPTGYIISQGVICQGPCGVRTGNVGFFN
ncbi:unnamed protein product [Caenorhabditis brenneri]